MPTTVTASDGEHIDLAQVEATRAVLELHADRLDQYRRIRQSGEQDLAVAGAVLTISAVVRRLARAYAGHPDFDPAWRLS